MIRRFVRDFPLALALFVWLVLEGLEAAADHGHWPRGVLAGAALIVLVPAMALWWRLMHGPNGDSVAKER